MEYAINDSKSTPPTSGWSLEMPVWKTGLFIWQRVKVSYSTGNPSYTTPHCLESNIIDDVTGNIGDWIFRDKTEILSGTEIWTDKADDNAVVHVEVDGKSYQDADESNLFDIQGWLLTPDSEKPVSTSVPYIDIELKPNTKYTVSTNIPNRSSTYDVFSMASNSSASSSLNGVSVNLTRTTQTLSDGILRIAMRDYSLDKNSDYWIKVDEGTINTPFAGYSSPTPDYPIEIHSLNDFDVVSSVGKENLIGGFNTIKGGWIADTGVLQVSTSLPRVASDFIEVVPGSDMTFTYDGYDYSGSSTKKVMGVYDKDKIFIERLASTVTDKVWKIKLNNQAKFVRLAYGTSSSEYDNYAKLEVGSESTPWNYSHKDLENNLNNNFIDKINILLDEPLRSVGDVKDRLFRDIDGLWKIERKVWAQVLDRNTTLNSSGAASYEGTLSTNRYIAPLKRSYGNANAAVELSSHLPHKNGVWADDNLLFGTSVNGATQFHFRLPNSIIGVAPGDSVITRTSKVLAWLESEKNNGNPFIVQYRLEKPEIETLPQSLQDKLNNLRSFKDSNYIYTVLPDKSNILSENLKPTLHATFKSIAWANDFRYKFEQSKAMHATDIWFAKGVSNTIAPNIGWSTDAPVWEDGLYIWSKTITTYGDGRTEETSPVCITGATGRSVDKIEEWYYLSNKSNSLEGGTWSKTPPTWTDGKYIWTKNKIIYKNPSGSEETAPINNTGGSGQKGETGTDARTVRLNNVIHAVHFDQDGLMPSVTSIAFPTAVQGFSGVTPYYEFKMGDTIVRGLSTDSSWTLNTSSMKYSDFPLAVTVNVVISGQTLATDTATIVGTKPGEDAYTVVLANESHTFAGDVSNAIAGSTTANVIAYRGGTQVGATIGNITGLPTGMTSTIYSNGTTSARVTFTVTTSMKTPNGVVNIPVTVNGKSFTKVFNYAIAFKGAKGDKGTDGIAGKDGVGIKTTVLAYASSASGTTTPTSGWTSTVPTVAPGNYLWTRTTWNYSDNSSENGYTVSRIGKDGNTGSNGVAGKDGVGIKSTVIHYGGSTSGTSHSGVAWTTAIPSVSNGQFLWTRTTWTYDDNTTETGYSVAKMGETGAKGDKGDKGDRGSDGIAGKDGVGIKTTTLNYASSTNGTTAPTSGWTTTIPTVAAGNYLWTRTTWTYTDNSVENGYTVSRIGKDGNTGKDGVAGKDGVGLTSTTITYAASTSGTTAPTSGWATTVPTVAVGSFLWTRTVWTYTDGTSETGYSVGKMGNTGPTGATGATGATGSQGPKGDTGTSVSSVTEYYLATSSNSGVTTSTSGWTTTIQTMTATNKYLWNYEQINFSDGTNQPTLPVIIGVYGDKGATGSTGATGRSITAIQEHYLATSASTGVTRSTSGWTTTMQTTTSTNKYLWNYETITWSSGTTTTYVEPIIIGVHGEQGPQGATGATGARGPQGATGTSVSSITEYYLATSASSGVTTSTSGWVTTMPTMTTTNKYLWNYEKVNFSDGTNQPTIPVIIGVHGATGATGGTGATGRSITAITEHYLATASASGVTRSTSGWSTTMQGTTTTNKYLWNYETITWNSAPTTTYVEPIIIGVHGATGSTGAKGDKGNPGENATARNFLLDSKPSSIIHTAAYEMANFILAESPKSGETYSLVIKGELASGKQNFGIYNSSGSSPLGSTTSLGNGFYVVTFNWAYATNTSVKIYAIPNSVVAASKIEWVTMVKGSVPLTEWVPAHEDIYKYVDDVEIGGTNLAGGSPSDWESKVMGVGTWLTDLTEPIPISSMGLKAGDTVTLSIELEAGSRPVSARIEFFKNNTERNAAYGNLIQNSTGVSSLTTTIPADRPDIIIRLQPDVAPVVTAYTIKYRRYKLEKGSKVTSWSPAPEDVALDVNKKTYNPVRYIRDWSNGSTANTGNHWYELMAFDEYGNNRALGGTVTSNGTGSNFNHLTNGVTAIGTYVSSTNNGEPVYLQVDLGKIYYNITEIKVWKYYNDGRTYKENKTEVSSDGVTWYPIYDYTVEGEYTPTEQGKSIPNTIAKTHSILTGTGTKNIIDGKADSSATEAALNEAAAKLQVLQQEVEAAATANELNDFIDKYNKDMASRDNAARESESDLSSALTSIAAIQNNLGDMSETWQFIDRFIKNTPQGIVVGNDSSGSYILIKEDRLSFYSNGQEVAFISQNLMEISRGAFVEQIQIAKYQFEESTTNHLTVRFVG